MIGGVLATYADIQKLGYNYGDTVPVTLRGETIEALLCKDAGDAEKGAPAMIVDASQGDLLGLTINNGSSKTPEYFAEKYNVAVPDSGSWLLASEFIEDPSFTVPAK